MNSRSKIEGKVGPVQFTVLVTLYIIGTSSLFAPPMLTAKVQQDAWLPAALGTMLGLVAAFLYTYLGKAFPGETFIQYNRTILGKWLGTAVNIVFLFFLLILCALVLRDVGDLIAIYVMPDTPIVATQCFFLAMIILGIRSGIEVFSRSMEIFFPWVMGLMLLLLLASIQGAKFTNILPLFEHKMGSLADATIAYTAFPFLELVTFTMCLPYVTEQAKARKAFLLGTGLGGLVVFILLMLCILVLGSETTARYVYPTYVLASQMEALNAFARLEVVVGGIWLLSIYAKLLVSFYALNLGVAQLFNLQEHRLLTFPLALFVLPLSIIVTPDIVYTTTEVPKAMTPLLYLVGTAIPVLLIGVAWVKRRFSSKI